MRAGALIGATLRAAGFAVIAGVASALLISLPAAILFAIVSRFDADLAIQLLIGTLGMLALPLALLAMESYRIWGRGSRRAPILVSSVILIAATIGAAWAVGQAAAQLVGAWYPITSSAARLLTSMPVICAAAGWCWHVGHDLIDGFRLPRLW